METAQSDRQEIISEIIGFDFSRLWATVRDLTIKPGKVAAEYCDGQRKRYLSPITYFLLVYGAVFFAVSLTDIQDQSLARSRSLYENSKQQYLPFATEKKQLSPEEQQKLHADVRKAQEFLMSKEGTLIIGLPLMLLFQWLFYKRYRKSFYHHLYFMLFVSAQLNILTFPLTFTLVNPALTAASIVILCIVLFGFWLYAEFDFYDAPKGTLVLRKIWQMLAMTIPSILWLTLVTFAAMLIVMKF